MEDLVVGIDLGTTNTCVSCFVDGRIKILENKEGGRTTPTYLKFMRNTILYGGLAKRQASLKTNCTEHLVYEIKRLVGRKFDDPHVKKNLEHFTFQVVGNTNNDPFILIKQGTKVTRKTPEDVYCIFLKHVRDCVTYKLGANIDKAVITVPAYFNQNQRKSTLEAAKDAGFKVLKLLAEPTAAAWSYFHENRLSEEGHYLVYDLGGGTFDVSILTKSANENVKVVGVAGNPNLGGNDFDNLLVKHVCRGIERKHHIDVTTDKRTILRIKNECEYAKKVLSTVEKTTIIIDQLSHGVKFDCSLTRKQLEGKILSLIKKTIKVVDNCLKDAQLSKADIREVILAGGSTRIPKVQALLEEYFDRKLLTRFGNPDECVAEGAALQAALLSAHVRQKVDTLSIVDVVPLSIGTKLLCNRMAFLIKRNSPLPVSYTETFHTVHHNQSSACVEVYEGERTNVQKNRLLGSFEVNGLTPAPPRECTINITMSFDYNNILKVTAEEVGQNNYKTLSIKYVPAKQSEKEVRNSLEDVDEEDERFVKIAKLRADLIEYCNFVTYNLNERNLTNLKYQPLFDACSEFVGLANGQVLVDNEEEVRRLLMVIKQKSQPFLKTYKLEFTTNTRI